ncbi:hypothetical protein DFQ27_009191 [Actinomortierella ambigua]|uniref:PQ-loop repeat-containing protein 1 n=1 Tax=Actinomortierella ambigua TaxID=1343610 RepID=A0A9P6QI03_9FUNG|nr:hypothetical protein DFQ27_009191 [Actinomortierella ambigua]
MASIDPMEPEPWNLIRIAMVIGPVTGYFHQYYTMNKMKTSMGFSSVTCGVLIVSSIIRVFFWIGEPFDMALLYQSILMIMVQLALLELCVRYYPWTVQLPTPVTFSPPGRHHTSSPGAGGVGLPSSSSNSNNNNNGNASPSLPITTRASRNTGNSWYRTHGAVIFRHFWSWPTIWPYYLFLAVFTAVVGLSLFIIGSTPFYVAVLGLAALGIEATVPLPQAIHNYQTKSTAGFSPAILLMWVIGDSFKTYYYISTHAKYQFVGCGIIQLCIDCVIICQTVIYSQRWRKFRSQLRSASPSSLHRHRRSSSEDHVGIRRSSSEALLNQNHSDDEI